jgi:hypothetical protein
MKKLMLSLTLFITALHSFSQSSVPAAKTSDYYLIKSRHQKTAALIMLGGGVGLTALGLAVSQANTVDYALGNTSNHNTAGTVLSIIGVASALGSIPLFISASHNRHKADLVFDMQKVPMVPYVACHIAAFQPVLELKIAL